MRESTIRGMDDPHIRLAHDSLTLLSAAERLQQGASDRASATYLPAAFHCVEQSLNALSRCCQGVAHALIPPAGHDDGVASRYALAAADWPGALDGVGPSHERQAQLLASLDDAAVALRVAADRCARTSRLLAATMEPPASVQDLRHRVATSTAA